MPKIEDPTLSTSTDSKQVRASIRNVRRLIELEPRHRGHRENLAELYVQDHRIPDALREWLALARDCATDWQFDDAISFCRRALSVSDDSTEAKTLLAEIYARAPRGSRAGGVIDVVRADLLDELAGPRDLPLDAAQLVAVHSSEEAGAEVYDEALFELSVDLSTATIDVDVRLVDLYDTLSSGDDSSPGLRPVVSTPELRALPPVKAFAGLPKTAMAELVSQGSRWSFTSGETVIAAGEPGDALYIIVSGAVRLTTPGPTGTVELGQLDVGGYFGDIEAGDHAAFAYDVVALTEVEVHKLDRTLIEFLRSHYPALDRALEQGSEIHRVQTLLAQNPLFAMLPTGKRTALARRFHPIALSPNEELFAEGDESGGLYLLTSGELQVYRAGGPPMVLLRGAVAGVVAAVHQGPAEATILAGPSAQVVCLDPEDVEHLLGSSATVRDAFWREAKRRRP